MKTLVRNALKTIFPLLMSVAVVLLVVTTDARAVSSTVSVGIAFDAPLTISKQKDMNMGIVLAGVADTYTIDTQGNVVAASSGQVLGGSSNAADLTLAGSATQSISISVANYNADNGVSIANATCAYDGGAEMPCALGGAAAPAGGKTLLLGAQVNVDGSQAVGSSAAPSFDVVVSYN